ncbi:TSFM [Cordylochernes scorpioides]|uniref:Elongation factor Ts, mitochondrial n=1 Tax=Cordylochernes scorpioides TaxID=51811 RepID=A0ABY6LEX0_9ARAC|nr:TSFM [Cordylochernes scorpioides]
MALSPDSLAGRCGSLRLLWSRFLGSRYLAAAVEKAALSALRKKTGYSFINCKKALEKYENNIEKAEVWLREEVQKEGWAKVSKMKDRTAAKGLIAVNYLPDQSAGAIVELKCETDFVAKTMEFQTLAASIAALCSKMVLQSKSRPDNALSKITLQPEELIGLRYSESGATIADAIALEVGKLGENAKLNRAVAFLGSSDLQVAACIHPTSDTSFLKIKDTLASKSFLLFRQKSFVLVRSEQKIKHLAKR